MGAGELYIDLLAFEPRVQPAGRLEQRIIELLEGDRHSESLDDPAFAQANGSDSKADYLLGRRGIVAELKTINADPRGQMESRLQERFQKPDAPIVFGTMGLSKVIENLSDRGDIDKMLVDMAGRAVRRHLRKANEQIGAIKDRLDIPHAGGLLIIMNDSEPMIDASAITYAVKSAFEAVASGYPHITNVWASIESHKVRMAGGRLGYPQIHIFRSLARQAQFEFMQRLFWAWAKRNGGDIEQILHGGDWEAMAAVYDGKTPTLSPFR